MCKPNINENGKRNKRIATSDKQEKVDLPTNSMPLRRGKRVKQASLPLLEEMYETKIARVSSRLSKKHEDDAKSGGFEAILPSLGIVIVLVFAIIAKNGWRGRASVAGVDLGTTNSVVCVQQQSKDASGKIFHGGIIFDFFRCK